MNKEKGNKISEDEVLIRAFQSGDPIAFDKLVLRYKDRVFSLCFRFLGDYQEAENCAQDVFLKIYRSLKNFRFESSFYTWLYRTAVNTCKNRLKSAEYRNLKRHISIKNPEEGDKNSRYAEPSDERKDPLAEIERKERVSLIQEAIDSLPAEHKGVIVLRDIEGLSYREIINITGYGLGTLKSKLARARAGLRQKLGRMI
jgi:RNA polymerase sigma-70 factor (ECF subfamily)